MRMTFDHARADYTRCQAGELDGDTESARWLTSMVNLLSTEQHRGTCTLTPLIAPKGQQTLYQQYVDALNRVAGTSQVRAALVAWERVDDYDGANLDERALRDAAMRADGKSSNAGAPGATWLELQSVPFHRQVAQSHAGVAIGWTRRTTFTWPVWTPLLNRPAIEALLAHPLVAEPGPALDALGVVGVCSVSRRMLANSAGPFGSTHITWSHQPQPKKRLTTAIGDVR
jgi:hypothetical protein